MSMKYIIFLPFAAVGCTPETHLDPNLCDSTTQGKTDLNDDTESWFGITPAELVDAFAEGALIETKWRDVPSGMSGLTDTWHITSYEGPLESRQQEVISADPTASNANCASGWSVYTTFVADWSTRDGGLSLPSVKISLELNEFRDGIVTWNGSGTSVIVSDDRKKNMTVQELDILELSGALMNVPSGDEPNTWLVGTNEVNLFGCQGDAGSGCAETPVQVL